MVINLFSNLENSSTLPEPLVKANQLLAENMEQMLLFQMNALKSYLDIGLNQMKAAAEITDIESFQDFCNCQTQIAQTVQQKLMYDTKALSDMLVRFQTEIDCLNRTMLETVLPKAA